MVLSEVERLGGDDSCGHCHCLKSLARFLDSIHLFSFLPL